MNRYFGKAGIRLPNSESSQRLFLLVLCWVMFKSEEGRGGCSCCPRVEHCWYNTYKNRSFADCKLKKIRDLGHCLEFQVNSVLSWMDSVRGISLEQKGGRLSFKVLDTDLRDGQSVNCEDGYMGISYIVLCVFSIFPKLYNICVFFKMISLLFQLLMLYILGDFYATFMLVIMSPDFKE